VGSGVILVNRRIQAGVACGTITAISRNTLTSIWARHDRTGGFNADVVAIPAHLVAARTGAPAPAVPRTAC
jgi:hypothetical protein